MQTLALKAVAKAIENENPSNVVMSRLTYDSRCTQGIKRAEEQLRSTRYHVNGLSVGDDQGPGHDEHAFNQSAFRISNHRFFLNIQGANM